MDGRLAQENSRQSMTGRHNPLHQLPILQQTLPPAFAAKAGFLEAAEG
jgi:hypothetical protein